MSDFDPHRRRWSGPMLRRMLPRLLLCGGVDGGDASGRADGASGGAGDGSTALSSSRDLSSDPLMVLPALLSRRAMLDLNALSGAGAGDADGVDAGALSPLFALSEAIDGAGHGAGGGVDGGARSPLFARERRRSMEKKGGFSGGGCCCCGSASLSRRACSLSGGGCASCGCGGDCCC